MPVLNARSRRGAVATRTQTSPAGKQALLRRVCPRSASMSVRGLKGNGNTALPSRNRPSVAPRHSDSADVSRYAKAHTHCIDRAGVRLGPSSLFVHFWTLSTGVYALFDTLPG